MSYCVNCGVELAPSEESCPLCGVVAINPANPYKQPKDMPYPKRVEKVISKVDRRFGVTLASLLLIIPVVIPLLSDMLTSGGVTWSAYVVGASACLFVWILVPYLFMQPKPYLFWAFDSLALIGYVALISYRTSAFSWFLPLGLPLCVSASLCVLLMIFIVRRKTWPIFYKMAATFAVFGIVAVLIDFIIANYVGNSGAFHWSLFVVSSCIVIALILISIQRRSKLRDEIKRRLFY